MYANCNGLNMQAKFPHVFFFFFFFFFGRGGGGRGWRGGRVASKTDLTFQNVTVKLERKILRELTQFSPRSHSRHLVRKRTAQNKTPSKTSPATAK